MANPTDRLFVVTGGPGSGKTSLIEHLAGGGMATSDEAGRAVIREQMAAGGDALPWGDRLAYAAAMAARDVAAHRVALEAGRVTLFDRGLPDVVGYLRLCGIAPPPALIEAAQAHRYNHRVFIAPFWPEIFEQDAERRQTAAEAEATHAMMVEVYRGLGYAPAPLPRAPIPKRAAFILEQIADVRG